MIREELYTGPKGSQKITTTVKAGETFNTRSVSKSFYIISSTGTLTITPEGRSASTFGAKSGLVFEGELPENLQISNETGADILVTLFHGFGKYLDENPAVLGAVTVTNSVLPTGASTAAKQDTGNTSLAAIEVSEASIDAKQVGVPSSSFVDSAATTNATVVKGAAGRLVGIVASNINAAIRYLKIYNKATAPNVGVDVPVMTLPIPATGQLNIDLGPVGFQFPLGIGFALTTLGTNADATAVAANEIKVALSYV